MDSLRIGTGYDIHKVTLGNGLYIGGINVCETLEFIAHSDGDVLIHALIDALVGACSEKDIGELFPDDDELYEKVSSTELLKKIMIFLDAKIKIINIDSIVIAEYPRLSKFKDPIKINLANLLNVPIGRVNLKAKTKEKIGEVGKGEAIECYCTVLIQMRK